MELERARLRNLEAALPQIEALCQALKLPPNSVETATQLY